MISKHMIASAISCTGHARIMAVFGIRPYPNTPHDSQDAPGGNMANQFRLLNPLRLFWCSLQICIHSSEFGLFAKVNLLVHMFECDHILF